MEDHSRDLLPPIGLRRQFSHLNGSSKSVASSHGSYHKLSFAHISKLHSSNDTFLNSNRTGSHCSLPGSLKGKLSLHLRRQNCTPTSSTLSLGSSRQLSAILSPNVSRWNILKEKDFTRTQSTSGLNVKSESGGNHGTCAYSSSSAGSGLNSPRNTPNGSRRQFRSYEPNGSLSNCSRESTVLTANSLSHQRVMTREYSNKTLICSPETIHKPAIASADCDPNSRTLTATAQQSQAINMNDQVHARRHVSVIDQSDSSSDSLDDTDEEEEMGSEQVPAETIHKCSDWLKHVEAAKTHYSLDVVVEAPVQWKK